MPHRLDPGGAEGRGHHACGGILVGDVIQRGDATRHAAHRQERHLHTSPSSP